MGVHEISSQAARTDSGVVLESLDRELMRVEYRDRVIDVPVERGMESYGFYLPLAPLWNDGSPVSAADLAVIKRGIVEIELYWGFRADFLVLEV